MVKRVKRVKKVKVKKDNDKDNDNKVNNNDNDKNFDGHKNIREYKQKSIEYWKNAHEDKRFEATDINFVAGADSIHDFNGSRIRGTDYQNATSYYLAANLYEFSNKLNDKYKYKHYTHINDTATKETDSRLSEWVKNSFGKKRAINPTGGSVEPDTEDYFQQKYSSQLYTDKKIKITYREIIEGFKKYSENGKLSNPDALKKLIINEYMNKAKKSDYYCMDIVSNYTGQDQSVFWNSFTPQDRIHIGIFILNFFMMNSTSEPGLNFTTNSYISFDANSPVLSKRIFTDMGKTVNNLVTPSNLADSAGSEKHLLNEKEQGELKNPKGPSRYTYYFPEHVDGEGKYYYTSNLFTYNDMVIYIQRDNPKTEYNHTNRYEFSINFKYENKETEEYTLDFGNEKYHTGPSVSYLGSLISNDIENQWIESHCVNIDKIKGKLTLANKTNNFKLLFDIKRSGDWEQCNACYHANTTKYKSRCILSTGDRLCSLYSRIIKQNVIFSNNDTLRMYRFPQSLTAAEARSMLDEKNIDKIKSTITHITAINEPLKKYYENIQNMRIPLNEKIEEISDTSPTKSTMNNSIETFLTKIAYILFEININKLSTFVDDYGKYLTDITLIEKAIDTPYTTSITKLGMGSYFANTPIPLKRWLTTHRGALNWYYHTESSDADKTEFITKFITRYLQKDEGTFLSKIEHFTNTFTNMFLITNISTLNLKKKFKIDKDSIVPTLVFGSYSIDNLYALKNKLTNIISFRNSARGKVVNLLDVIGNDFFDILREINSEIDNNEIIFTDKGDIKKDIHQKITNVLNYIDNKEEDKTNNDIIKCKILGDLDMSKLSKATCGQGGGGPYDKTGFVSIQELNISDSVGMLDYNIFLSFFTDGAKIIEDGIKPQESPNIDLFADFIPQIDELINYTTDAKDVAAKDVVAATDVDTDVDAAIADADNKNIKWNIKNNLKYIYDLLPILYNRSIIHFKVWEHFDTKFFSKALYSNSKGIIPGKNYKKTESNLTYIVIQSEREDILFALNEYKIKGGETIVPDGKEDVYNLVNEYLYKDITFSESLFSSISDYEKELNEHTFTGMVKIGLIKGSNGQIYSNTLSYGLTNLIQSLIATFSFLIIIDHYDDDVAVDLSDMDNYTDKEKKEKFKVVFTQLYGKYLLFEFDHAKQPKEKTCLEQMSTLISCLPDIDIILVYNALKEQLSSYTPSALSAADKLTKQNKFYKLLAHIYVFYNDINCEYIKVVKDIPKKKIAAEVAEVAEGVVEGTVVTPVVEKEDDEDCSCFIGDDTDDAATVDDAVTVTAASTMLQIVNSMPPNLNYAVTEKEETPEQKAAINREIEAARNREIELLMNNNMDNNSSGIMEPITNVYDYITKEKYIENYIKKYIEKYNSHPKKDLKIHPQKDLKIHRLPRRFKVKETLEKTVRFKKDHSQGIQFLYRNSYIFIYLYLKYILQDNIVPYDAVADYSNFIKGGSNEQSIEEQMIRLIS
jgi:hypothetical protein